MRSLPALGLVAPLLAASCSTPPPAVRRTPAADAAQLDDAAVQPAPDALRPAPELPLRPPGVDLTALPSLSLEKELPGCSPPPTGGPPPWRDGPPSHYAGVTALAFAPDGRLASGDAGVVLVRDPRTGAVLLRREATRANLTGLEFSPDGSTLLLSTWTETAALDGKTGVTLWTDDGGPTLWRYSPDGRLLARATTSRVVTILDTATRRPIRTVGAARPEDGMMQDLIKPVSISFSPDGTQLATARWDDSVRLWDVATGEELSSFPGRFSVEWSPDGQVLASGAGQIGKRSTEMFVFVLNRQGEPRGAIPAPTGEATFSPDGRYLLSAVEGQVVLWEAADLHPAARAGDPDRGVFSFAISPDGERLAIGGRRGDVRLYRMP